MTIPSNVTRNSYTGTGIPGPYPVTFKFFEDADLRVTLADADGVETVKTLTTDYTVTGAGEQAGGAITFTTAVTNGYSIVIEPVADLTQDTDIKNEGGNLRESIEDRFDRLCRDDQVQQNLIDRSLKLATTEDLTSKDPVLPRMVAGSLLGVTDDGTGFAMRSASLFSADATITADGSTTPRWISDRFGEVANVRDFGATGDGVTDDTNAVAAANATGKPIFFPDGTYVITTVNISSSPAVFGNGAAIIKINGNTTAFVINRDETLVYGLRFQGSGIASGFTSQTAIDNYKTGDVVGTLRNNISHCYFIDIAGRGIRIAYLSAALHREGNRVIGCHFDECLTGFYSDTLGEYTTLVGCSFRACTYGARVAGGNTNFSGCLFDDNVDGLNIVGGGPNDSHGIATGCQFNHNTYPLDINGILYGYTFSGCTIYQGTLNLVSCVGVQFNDGQLDCTAYSFDGSLGTVFRNNLMPYGYDNTIANNVNGHQSRTAWIGNHELTGQVRPFGWGSTIIGGFARADYVGGAAQVINNGVTANLNPKVLTSNFTATNASYTADTFYNTANGEFTCKGHGDSHANVKLNVLLSGAGALGTTYMVIKVNGTAREYVPLTIFNGLYMYTYNGVIHLDNADVLTFSFTNGSGNTVTIAATADSWIEVEGL